MFQNLVLGNSCIPICSSSLSCKNEVALKGHTSIFKNYSAITETSMISVNLNKESISDFVPI